MKIKGVNWVDDDTLDDEVSDLDFQKKIIEEGKKRDFKKFGRDGMFSVWKKTFRHRGLHFKIKVMRYYVLGEKILHPHKKTHSFFRMGNHRGMYAVLEYPNSMKKIVSFVNSYESELGRYDFLWADTLHTWNDGMNLRQRFELMYKQGKSDIDWWLDDAGKEFAEHIQKTKKDFKRLRNEIKKR